MALFNEIAASGYIYIMMLLTDFWGESQIRDSIGWGLLIFLTVVVMVNFAKVLWKFSKWAYSKIKLKYCKKKFTKVMLPTVAIKTEFEILSFTNDNS